MHRYYKYIFFIVVLNGPIKITDAQVLSDTITQRPMNLVYINLMGGSTSTSLEYERLLGSWTYRNWGGYGRLESFFISGGLGIGMADMQDPNVDKGYMTLPIHLSFNYGNRASCFETGIGTTILFGYPDRETITYFNIGYRLEPRRKYKFLFRLNFCIPFDIAFALSSDLTFIPLGLSFGIAF